MKVLVLLSTYNGEKYLKEQIDSVLAQKNVDLDILVRDDGSTDNTVSLLESIEKLYSNVNVIYGSNVGCAQSFGILIREAYTNIENYNYYAFCDQDDVWFENKIEEAIKHLSEYEEDKPNLYCSNLIVTDKRLNPIGYKYEESVKLLTKGESLVCSIATGCTMLFNKKVVQLFSKMTPRRMIVHDLWIFHTCLFLGNVFYDSNGFIFYRQHGANVIGAKLTLKEKFRSKFFSLLHLFSEHENEVESKELLFVYSKVLSEEDSVLISKVAKYRETINNRICLFRDKQIRRISDNWILKIRILLGVV